MNTRPRPSSLAMLLHDLARFEGEELEFALADSAAMFARLGAHAAPRGPAPQRPGGGPLSMARAERELSGLIARELERLCEQAAAAGEEFAPLHPTCDDLSELLIEELDCARSTGCLPPSILERARELARQLPRAACASSEFRSLAASIRDHFLAADQLRDRFLAADQP